MTHPGRCGYWDCGEFFPVLKKQNEGMALGFVGAWTGQGVLVPSGSVSALLVMNLSQDHGQAGGVGVQRLADLLLAAQEWTYRLGPMAMFSVSALILYTLLYRSRLVSTWLSVCRFIGGALLLASALLEMFAQELGTVQAVFSAPVGINEMVLAVWLIVRGFNAAPFEPEHKKQAAVVRA